MFVPPPIPSIKYIAAGDGANCLVTDADETGLPFIKQSNVEVAPLYLQAKYVQLVNGPADEIVLYGDNWFQTRPLTVVDDIISNCESNQVGEDNAFCSVTIQPALDDLNHTSCVCEKFELDVVNNVYIFGVVI